MFAAQSGHMQIAELLLQAGSDVNHKDSRGLTPLALASQHGYSEVMTLLFEHGAELENILSVPPTDSAYESAYLEKDRPNTITPSEEQETTLTIDLDDDEVRTQYSDTPSAHLPLRLGYISGIADHLFSKISSWTTNKETWERVQSALPSLLKDFAQKIGFDATTQKHQEVMAFIHQYRGYEILHA